jgi:DNA (cytosine-5)-methyltransferase 1
MKPRLLDLFCGAGGAAVGYQRAGFEVVGVDIKPQKHYPFEFHQADALEYLAAHGREFDAIHASPPCQKFSKSVSKANRAKRPDYVGPTRDLLMALGLPWVIENVPGAPLRNPITLCGSSFGLDVRRHRRFEMSAPPILVPPCRHGEYRPRFLPAFSRTTLLRFRPISGGWTGEQDLDGDRAGMGIEWPMSADELSEAIPPAYTEWIGKQLLAALAPQGEEGT